MSSRAEKHLLPVKTSGNRITRRKYSAAPKKWQRIWAMNIFWRNPLPVSAAFQYQHAPVGNGTLLSDSWISTSTIVISASGYLGIILSHGTSTASSIADAANSLLNSIRLKLPICRWIHRYRKSAASSNDFIEEKLVWKHYPACRYGVTENRRGDCRQECRCTSIIFPPHLPWISVRKIQQHYELENLLETAWQQKINAITRHEEEGKAIVSYKWCRYGHFRKAVPIIQKQSAASHNLKNDFCAWRWADEQ